MDGSQSPTAANANENGNELPRAQPAESMSVTFRDQANFEVQFRLKAHTKLGKAMDHFSARSEQDRQTLRFLFEGQRVLPESTMESVRSLQLDVGHLDDVLIAATDRNGRRGCRRCASRADWRKRCALRVMSDVGHFRNNEQRERIAAVFLACCARRLPDTRRYPTDYQDATYEEQEGCFGTVRARRLW